MTVNTTNITSGPYVGNGLVNEYDYDFGITDENEIRVFETDDLGNETELVLNTDFTVTGVGTATGGTVIRTAGNLPTDYTWYMRSNILLLQETAFASQGTFFPYIHEDAMDKLTRLAQQNADLIGRTIRLSDSEIVSLDGQLPTPIAGRSVKFQEDTPGQYSIVLTDNDIDDNASAAATAQVAAEAAQTGAEAAQVAAEAAQVAAETAQVAAEAARTGAETAQTAAETAQTAAETAQTAAETAQTAAAASESAAAASESAAASSESAAAASASAAAASESAAAASESAAAASASAAAASESAAAASEAKSQKWAEEAEDVEVEVGKYSAKHHAAKAATSAASINLPLDLTGQGGKNLQVNATEDGYEHVSIRNFKNKMVNGAFEVDQIGGASVTASGLYVIDQWYGVLGVDGAGAVSQQSFVAGQTDVPKAKNFLRWDQTVADSGTPQLWGKIEYVATLENGKATLSFSAKAEAAHNVNVQLSQVFGSGGSATASTAGQTISLTTAWQKFELVFDLPTVSGKVVGTGDSLQIRFLFPTATTFTLDLAQVQIEEGAVTTTFEDRPLTVETMLCRRYFRSTYNAGVSAGTVDRSGEVGGIQGDATAEASSWVNFDIQMRTTPVITTYSPATGAAGYVRDLVGGADVTSTLISAGDNGFSIAMGTASINNQYAYHYAADARL